MDGNNDMQIIRSKITDKFELIVNGIKDPFEFDTFAEAYEYYGDKYQNFYSCDMSQKMQASE